MEQFLQQAKDSSRVLANLSGQERNKLLLKMADALEENAGFIEEKNAIDMENGKKSELSSSLMDRLFLDKARIFAMAKAIKEIASMKDPIGRVLDGWINEDDLKIEKVSVPIGVIGIIFESRPNVTSDTAALCFKSGNVCVLKGGKEAQESNQAIAAILQDVLSQNNLPKEMISLLPDASREGVAQLIKQDAYVDLIIPRGGEALIRYVNQNASVPVVKHDKGLCHIYIDKDADQDKAIKIAINAKVQRPGVCNAMETLLVDESIAASILPEIKSAFAEHKTLLKGCETTKSLIDVELATHEDFHTEYLENILSIKVVAGVEGAIDHIAEYGSGHSESIITQDYSKANQFLDQVDAAACYVNASTRFTDGGAFGFGAEVGISTNKLHARGPMGIEGLTTYKFKIYGEGQVRK
ncbi:MAG: glutamate-5-semialdehyde dehydrogenase [Thiovulaceae bacterium]|nr:glutamate-5-semialdehyde dehydrogenase [Sulfurimonadaceae bacterium]